MLREPNVFFGLIRIHIYIYSIIIYYFGGGPYILKHSRIESGRLHVLEA